MLTSLWSRVPCVNTQQQQVQGHRAQCPPAEGTAGRPHSADNHGGILGATVVVVGGTPVTHRAILVDVVEELHDLSCVHEVVWIVVGLLVALLRFQPTGRTTAVSAETAQRGHLYGRGGA
jgi:hypothetical protein